MLITTLGTSHGDHTYCRFNSSTLFEIGEHMYLVDAGAPVNGLMIRAEKSFDRLNAVFITHMHDDHVGGLPGLIKSLRKLPRDGHDIDVFLPEPGAVPALTAWLEAQHEPWPSPLVTVRVVHEGKIFDDGVLSVRAVGTQHLEPAESGIPVSFSYVLEAEEKRIVYTGDLSADFSDFPQIAQQERCELCLCEVTHYNPLDAFPVFARSPIQRLVLNHVHDPWHGEGEKRLREILSGLPYPFDIAHDGDAFEV